MQWLALQFHIRDVLGSTETFRSILHSLGAKAEILPQQNPRAFSLTSLLLKIVLSFDSDGAYLIHLTNNKRDFPHIFIAY
jgi:hypothetical protein